MSGPPAGDAGAPQRGDDDVIDRLVANNESYVLAHGTRHVPITPALGLAVVACMDSRLFVSDVLGLRDGDAHIIRNAGGVVTDDVVRSLIVSQRLLGTQRIMLLHHTDCGQLKYGEDEMKAEIEAEVGIRPPFAFESFPDLEADVRQSMARLRSSPYLHATEVRGFVFDVDTGRLHEVT